VSAGSRRPIRRGSGAALRGRLWWVPLVALAPSAQVRGGTIFDDGEAFSLPGSAFAFAVEDLDLDGRPDVAAVHPSEGLVSVLLDRPSVLLAPAATYTVGPSPISIFAAPLDGNGSPDLAIIESGSSTVSILLNGGDGTFAAGKTKLLSGSPRAAQGADFDGDGDIDLVVTNMAAFNLKVLLGDGRGDFVEGVPIPVGDNTHSLTVADFDGDGRADVAVAHRNDQFVTGIVSWFRSRGDGTFEAPRDTSLQDTGDVPRWIASGDLDGDGRLDMAVLGNDGGFLFLRSGGDGSFDLRKVGETSTEGLGIFGGFILAQDLDGDGLLDLAAPWERRGEEGLRILRGSGGGAFDPPEDIYLGGMISAAGIADLDRDGRADLIAALSGDPVLRVHRAASPGRFAARRTVPLEFPPKDLVSLDVGRDGRTDLAVLAVGAVHILRSSGDLTFGIARSVDLPGTALQDALALDFDGDGEPDLALSDRAGNKILIVLLDRDGAMKGSAERPVHLLPSRLASADFDGDGAPDIAVAHQTGSVVSWVSRTGAEARDVSAGQGQTALEAADADGDGAADLLVSVRDGLLIAFGDGRGEFPRSRLLAGLSGATALRIADVDGDGSADLVAALRDRIAVLFRPGIAEEPERIEVDPGAEVMPLAVRDLDGDGSIDILAGAPEAAVVLRGDGKGGFGTAEMHPIGVSPVALVSEDLDGDGRIDCASANSGSWSISVLPGRGEAPRFRRGDVDGSGKADLTDAVVLLGHLFLGGAPPDCPDSGDSNDDGRLDLTDAIVLLSHLYLGGPPPPQPGPSECGPDPTADGLGRCSEDC
jgi:hypothetical protein